MACHLFFLLKIVHFVPSLVSSPPCRISSTQDFCHSHSIFFLPISTCEFPGPIMTLVNKLNIMPSYFFPVFSKFLSFFSPHQQHIATATTTTTTTTMVIMTTTTTTMVMMMKVYFLIFPGDDFQNLDEVRREDFFLARST